MDQFTDEQIDAMARQVDEQLSALFSQPAARVKTLGHATEEQPQLRAITQATGEDAPSFLVRFKQAFRKDLCEEGGILNAQWRTYRDLASKDLVKGAIGALGAIGLTTGQIPAVAVAVSVYILHLGADAFCQGREP